MKKIDYPKVFKNFRFTSEMKETFQTAAKYAKLDKIGEVTVFNFLYTVLRSEADNIILETLEAMKVDVGILFESIFDKRGESENKNSDNIVLSKEITQLILDSYSSVVKLKSEYGIEDLFMAMLKHKNSATEIFIDNALEHSVFKATYEEVVNFYAVGDGDMDMDMQPTAELFGQIPLLKNKKGFDVIKTFTNNMNDEFSKGGFSECIGRDKEIAFLERVLNRSKKKNTILIGKAGVGKTQIVEGLVQRIVEKKTAITLQDKVVISLNINAMEASSALRGQLEEKIQLLTNYLQENTNVILFIDEIHNIMGMNKNSSIDLSNVLKPYLTKDKLQIIGATTTEEYKIYIQNNRAFSRRFAVQHIEELSKEDTLEIIKKIGPKYEKYHNVSFEENLLQKIVDFCHTNLRNLSFPDKALDVIDDLGASLVAKQKENEQLAKISNELKKLRLRKQDIIENKKYEEIEDVNRLEQHLKGKYDEVLAEQKNEVGTRQVITEQMFLDYVKETYKIENYFGDDFDKLIENAETEIKSKLFGQDEVVDGVLNHIKMKKLFDDYDTPLSFFFVGEAGVGKTYLSSLLAKTVFKNKIKTINCELYKEPHSISNLVGAPKGYVDSESGSELFEYIKHNPESIILLDEVEKAHPNFFDFFLSFLDKGVVEDKDGFVIDARRCAFIFTTNIGFEGQKSPQIGYTPTDSTTATKMSVEKSIKRAFRPEFIDRLDEVYQFNSVETFEEAINKEFDIIKAKLSTRNIDVSLSEETKNEILETCKKEKFAYRSLKRMLKKKVMQNLSVDYKQQRQLKV